MDSKLQDDFPIDWEEDQYVSRREFFKFMTLASGGLALGSAALAGWAAIPPRERKFDRALIAKIGEVKVGESLEFSYPRPVDPCILLHLQSGEYVAYSRRCTHLSCPVVFQAEKQRLYCPCHNGAFAADDGHVLQGPPPRPLPQIQLQIENGEIFAIGVVQS